jgi:hypothetical protein
MDYQCRWTKDQKAKAKETGLGLFAVACDRASGRFESTGLMSEARCALLFSFGWRLYRGESPQEALDNAIVGMTDLGRAMLAEPAGRHLDSREAEPALD